MTDDGMDSCRCGSGGNGGADPAWADCGEKVSGSVRVSYILFPLLQGFAAGNLAI